MKVQWKDVRVGDIIRVQRDDKVRAARLSLRCCCCLSSRLSLSPSFPACACVSFVCEYFSLSLPFPLSVSMTPITCVFMRALFVCSCVCARSWTQIPADMLLLGSSHGNSCFVETVDLDGETNLKVKDVVTALRGHSEEQVMGMEGD